MGDIKLRFDWWYDETEHSSGYLSLQYMYIIHSDIGKIVKK